MQALKLEEKTPYITQQLNEWHELWFNDYKKAGYVAISNLKRQLFYGSNDIQTIIDQTAGKPKQYISINAFNGWINGKPPNRRKENLKQIRNIAIDIDQYDKGMTINEALDEIQYLILEEIIPEPNLVLTSRGIQIFYSIEYGASPTMAWLSDFITSQFISKLKHIGADFNAKDVSRLMRVPNSMNERNNALVKSMIWNNEPYSLDELKLYCRPLNRPTSKGKKKRRKVVPLHEEKRVSLIYKINHARLQDLNRLIEIRKGNFTGMRNTLLYMYAYHEALLFNNQSDVLNSVNEAFKNIYSTSDKPMTKSEFNRTVKSAYNDATRFFNSFKENGYNIIYKTNDGIKKPYKTSNVIKKLDISEAEQYELNTLHEPHVKRNKDIKRLEQQRRKAGMRTMKQYNDDRKQKQQSKLDELQQLLEDKPNATRKELASILGITTRTLRNYISKLEGRK